MYYELYLVTNLINGKKYIGQTNESVGYLKRFQNHIKESKQPFIKSQLCVFHRAIAKYGEENFQVKLLLKHIPEDQIDFYEKLWISKFNTFWKNGYGYNMTYGGSGLPGHHHSENTKELISQSIKSYWQRVKENPEEYNRLCNLRSQNLKGIPKSEETKKKLSMSAKERYKREINPFSGKHHTNDVKTKIGQANGYKVAMLDLKTEEVLKTFYSAMQAANYLIEQGKTTNKYANCRILWTCEGTAKSAYGYKWKFIDEV